MDDYLRLATYGTATLMGAYVLKSIFYTPKLNSIPAIGPSGVLSSYVGAYRYLVHGKDMIQEGYAKYRVFRVPLIHRWDVIISGRELVEELRASKEEELSIREAFNEILQTNMTMGPNILGNPYHISVTRVGMTKNLDARFDEVRDEIICTFQDHLKLEDDEWRAIPAQATVMQVICRTGNRLFVGLPLCRNTDYLDLNFEFTISVVMAAQMINILPGFLRPILGPWISPLKKLGNNFPGRPNDLISWLLDVAEGEERTVPALVQRILVINFGAVHTSANTFTHALFNLAAFPSSVEEMREEVENIVKEEGWSKVSVAKMHKVDSFLRESQRYSGNSITGMGRKVVKPGGFTFSDGTTVPEGCFVNVATGPTHSNPDVYQNPDEFDAFRFYRLRTEDEEDSLRHQFSATNLDYLSWGHGRHACPGRFFASTALKTMLAHILVTYDVKLEDESAGRPPNQCQTLAYYGIASVLGLYALSKTLSGPKLDFIPTLGSSNAILSFREVFRYIFGAKELCQEGYQKYPDGMFRVPNVDRWNVMATGKVLMEEIASAPESELSFYQSINEFLQTGYTMGWGIVKDTYHANVVRTSMTRNLGVLFPEVRDEIVVAFDDVLPVQGKEWLTVPAFDTMMQIVCRTSNRLFVGLPLCRDPAFIKLNVDYAMDVIIAGQLINMLPAFLRPTIGPLLSPRKRILGLASKHLTPVVEERFRKEQELGDKYTDKPNDLITWLMEAAEGEERTVPALVQRVLFVNFAAIRTSTDTFTHVLYDLAAYPHHVEPLREEVESVVQKEGWTRASLNKMYKIDSFLSESQRHWGIGTLSLGRKVVKKDGFTFANGTTLPYGTYLHSPMWSVHHDPEIYPDPEVFDGFRFSKLRESEESGSAKYQVVTTSLDYLPFGHGEARLSGTVFRGCGAEGDACACGHELRRQVCRRWAEAGKPIHGLSVSA
ncbi:Cytochrome P450 [Mycena venus]|uniref:Cytochrome P450 n=1 Tax=Mycena venus TaxID=2733690 RepID=A0A8H6Y4E9_9AGAR|nr:Cytochrome P450 [Mycena venus]